MCLAVPAKVISIEGQLAKVDISGNVLEADVSILESVAPGDYVIVHAGMAIEKYEHEEALRTLDLFRELAQRSGI